MTSSEAVAATDEPDDSAALVFNNVSMVFPDGTEALENIDLNLSRGEFVSLVGPSGCGKSTVLKLASGLLTHTAGTIEIAAGNVGYVFQEATLLPWRTVKANIELFMQLHDIDKAERSHRADEAIKLVGLEEFTGHYPSRLSGGMKMRVSLARSLTLNPSLFMFDEPFGALDEITREHLNTETMRLFKQLNFAGLFVTHSVFEAAFMSSRVLVMSSRPGRIIADIEVPFDYPRNDELRFDAEFGRLGGEISDALRAGHSDGAADE